MLSRIPSSFSVSTRSLTTGSPYLQKGLNSLKSFNPWAILCAVVITTFTLSLLNRHVRRFCTRSLNSTAEKISQLAHRIGSYKNKRRDVANPVVKRDAEVIIVEEKPPEVSSLPLPIQPEPQIEKKTQAETRETRLYKNNEEAMKSLEKQTTRAKQKIHSEPVHENPYEAHVSFISPPQPISKKLDVETHEIGKLEIGIASTVGMRQASRSFNKKPVDMMEDRAKVFKVESKKCPGIALVVFDGHGGTGAAEFANEKIVEYLKNNLDRCITTKVELFELMNGLKETIRQIDREYTSKPEEENADDGTTCTLVFIPDENYFKLKDCKQPFLVANTGDSRAVIINENGPIRLTADADPADEDFAKSIRARGGDGYIYNGRVYPFKIKPGRKPIEMGSIEVARAIGDRLVRTTPTEEKPEGNRLLTCNPKISYGDLEGGLLLVFTDGLSKVVHTHKMAKAAENLNNVGLKKEIIAETLVKASFNAGSEDNITLIVAGGI